MRIFSFDQNGGRPLTSWIDENGVSHRVDPKTSKVVISPIFASEAPSHFACFYIGKGGFIPRHRARGPQLFAIVQGRGWVTGEDGEKHTVQAGQAVYWASGETHESGTDEGMRVIVVEGDTFDPAMLMREIKR